MVEKKCPADIPVSTANEMRRIAQETFSALGIHDFGRVDLRMDAEGNNYVLELNSMASLGLSGSYVHAAKVAGYSYDSLVNRMLDVAAVRYFGEMYSRDFNNIENASKEKKPLKVRIRSYIRSNQTTMEDLLRKMVEINTHVYNVEGVNDLGNFISGQLKQLAFNKHVFPQVDIGNSLYLCNHEQEHNDILLWDHLDNRSAYNEYVPFYGERGRYFGSGVAENKGGLSVMLTALRALRFSRNLRKVKCGILLTTDYSLGGKQSKKLIEDISGNSHYVVGLKWGEAHGGIVTSCFGRAGIQIEISNIKSIRESKHPGVITALCKKIIAMEKLSSESENIEVKPISIDAQSSIGSSPDFAVAALNLQFISEEQGVKIVKDIRTLVRKNIGKSLKVQIKQVYYRPPVIESEVSKKFYMMIKKLADNLEIRIESFNRIFSSDISYVPEGIPVLDGLGPSGGSTRTPHEYIYQDSMIDRAAILAMIIYSCSQGGPK